VSRQVLLVMREATAEQLLPTAFDAASAQQRLPHRATQVARPFTPASSLLLLSTYHQ
jgi:hypothetical protein